MNFLSQLSGCTVTLDFRSKTLAQKVIQRLSTCEAHRGQHHFAVVNDGLAVAMSPIGRDCINEMLGDGRG